MQATKRDTMSQQTSRKDPGADNVYMMIRFRDDTVQSVRNAILGQSGHILENYNGRLLGIAEEVKVFEDDESRRWPRNKGMMIIEFQSDNGAVLAKRWLCGDPKFRAKDFPNPSDNLEIILIPKHNTSYCKGNKLQKSSPTENLTFVLEELCSIENTDLLQQNYIVPVAKVMDEFQIQHGAGFATEVEVLRGTFTRKGNPVTLHRAESETKFREFYYSAKNEKLRQERSKYCRPMVAVFTLVPLKK